MAENEKLSEGARKKALGELAETGWAPVEGRDAIQKRFEFEDFSSAMKFMSRGARFAEKHNHHPEWTNVYRTVDVTLTTHSVKGLSKLDVKFARRLDTLANPAEG
jgi:4a-hydroxytetrahydrobiopterin dehydratase